MKPVLFILVAVVSSALADVTIKSLVFPAESSDSYVELSPLRPLNVTAFTLCMRVATELELEVGREVILFAYRTQVDDALNVWREKDGKLSFYLSGEGVLFEVPNFGPLQTHLCFTWDSSTGAANVFIDGKKSVTKIYKQGHTIPSGGKVILGQDPDTYLGSFDANQSLVGEIFDVNMGDSVLPDSVIQDLLRGMRVPRGNIFDWESTPMKVNGNVHEITQEL